MFVLSHCLTSSQCGWIGWDKPKSCTCFPFTKMKAGQNKQWQGTKLVYTQAFMCLYSACLSFRYLPVEVTLSSGPMGSWPQQVQYWGTVQGLAVHDACIMLHTSMHAEHKLLRNLYFVGQMHVAESKTLIMFCTGSHKPLRQTWSGETAWV